MREEHGEDIFSASHQTQNLKLNYYMSINFLTVIFSGKKTW